MNLQFYFEKLKSSKEFGKFKKENPSSFLCSAFFSIDKKGNDNKQHFDYFLDEKILSFQIEDNCKGIIIETIDKRIPEKLSENLDFDFNDIERIIEKEMKSREIKKEIQKYILSLQKMDGINYLLETIFVSGMGILQVKINIDEMKIIDFEEKSFFDVLKVIKKK